MYYLNCYLKIIYNSIVLSLTAVIFQDGVCDKNSAPSVSSISRLLRGGRRDETDLRGKNHSIDGILGKSIHLSYIGDENREVNAFATMFFWWVNVFFYYI
jgi:hypothetical protein